jgi:hypothetical protein
MGVNAQVCRVEAPAQGGAGSGEDAESDGEQTILPPEELAAANLLRSARADTPAVASPGRTTPAERIAVAKPKRAASATPRAPKQTRRLSEAPAGRAASADGDMAEAEDGDRALPPLPRQRASFRTRRSRRRPWSRPDRRSPSARTMTSNSLRGEGPRPLPSGGS